MSLLLLGALLSLPAAGPRAAEGQAPPAQAAGEPNPAELRFAFWNLENLFDTQDDPRNPGDDEFLPGTGWDEARYARKLDHLAGVIAELDPHLLGVCEIENRRVLEDLLRDPRLAGKEYRIEHVDSPDRRGIDLALLHRGPFELSPRERAVHLHPIALPEGKGPTRGILEVNLVIAQQPLTVLVNHWPSRSGGAEESIPNRISAAETARRIVTARLDEERAAGREADVLLIGDFNDDPFDPSIAKHLDAVRGKFALEGDRGRTRLYNPSWAFLGTPDRGTIYYEAGWNVFDQAIISRGLLRDPAGFVYVEGSLAIHDADSMRNRNHPARPPRWFRKYRDDWDEGFSDHFAIHGCLRVAAPGD
jgi:endonuclease/exonuclease/phosphatase family metal-dependent hydrolase